MSTQIARKTGWYFRLRLGLIAAGLSFFGAASFAQTGKPEKLQCESLIEPLGMDTEHPVFVVATPRFSRRSPADCLQDRSRFHATALGHRQGGHLGQRSSRI